MRHTTYTLVLTGFMAIGIIDPAGVVETRALAQSQTNAQLETSAPPATPASPASPASIDARWLAWIGCWRSEAERLISDTARLCVVPARTGNPQAVRILVVVDDVVATEQVMTADGVPAAVSENGCRGDRSISWSSRGTSRYSRMQLGCPVGPPLKASGLTLMMSGPLWLTVEVTQSYGREIVEVLKYSRATVPAPLAGVLTPDVLANAGAAADTLLATPFDLEDVIEASKTIAPKAIEVALLETGTALPVNRRTLIALDDADVSPTVIDLMVALAYPKKFVVKAPTAASGWSTNLEAADFWWSDFLFADYPSSPTYYLFYDGGGSGGGGGGDSGDRPPVSADLAFAVKGKGYAQVQPVVPTPVTENRNSGSGNTVSSSSRSSGGADSGGGRSSSASSSGYTGGSESGGGGGGGDTGRTAVHRE